MIQSNTHNPIPIHTSRRKWYDTKGACRPVVAPLGQILPAQYTITEDDVPTLSIRVTEVWRSASVTFEGTPYSNNGTIVLKDTNNNHIDIVDHGGYYTMKYYDVKNSLTYDICKSQSDSTKVNFSESDLRAVGTREYTLFSALGIALGNMRFMSGILSPAVTLSAKIIDAVTNEVVESNVSISTHIDIVPQRYRTRNCFATIGYNVVELTGNYAEGMYYMEFAFGGETYVSEPWLWKLDCDTHMVHMTYRRTSPILTAKNYLPFRTNGVDIYMDMYIDVVVNKPPFQYESEVRDLDGYKFVQKQVSYVARKFRFLCSSYFADAIRMMWHCDHRVFSYEGEINDVDYMEAPEPKWDYEALCEVEIELHSDTIMQTNGTTTMPITEGGSVWDDKSLPAALRSESSFDSGFVKKEFK